MIPCQYDNAADFSEGMAVVMDEIGPMTYQYGCIDTTGKEVVPCQYKGMRDFSDGLARVQGDNNKYGYIDKSGKLVIPASMRAPETSLRVWRLYKMKAACGAILIKPGNW